MANCLPFSKNQNMACEEGTVTWTNELVNQSPLAFSNTDDSLNETYTTAGGENETQYLSVLDSDDETLQDINNLTLSNKKLIGDDDIAPNMENDNNFDLADSEQVVIFNVEGSDELYGLQIAHDEDGNVHRYQFQFRKTDNGQLEAMPETIQLLTNEEDPPLNDPQSELIEFTEDQVTEDTFEHPVLLQEGLEQSNEDSHHQLMMSEQATDILENESSVDGNMYNDEEGDMGTTDNSIIYIKNENMCNEMTYEDEEELNEDCESDYNEELIDIKPGVDIVKQELLHKQNEAFETYSENSEEAIVKEDYTSEADSCSTVETENQNETIISYQHLEHVEEYFEDSRDSHIDHNEATHFLVEENNLDQLNYNIELQHQEEKGEGDEDSRNVLIVENDPGTNLSENEDYEFEGLPVTAEEDTSSSIYQETEVLYTEPEITIQTLSPKDKLPKTSNILKQPTNMNKMTNGNKKTILYYMVPSTDQKENLNSITLKATNPRSVLKNNIELHKMNDERIKTLQREKLLEKRYARSKEVIQAKMFNNFINKTTIPHAPVRQGRLPRKQEIKPVDTRTNEEIIVQEVMVSSKGFVENLNDRLKNLDKLEVTSIVELSDSDEEYDPKNSTKKKKKHKKIPTNAESSDSDTSIIEIHSDEETTVEENSVKKNRDSPKKDSEGSEGSLKRSRGKGSKSESSNRDSPHKKSRTEESSEVESDTDKKEINCPHCSKTFPNQNSLSTHIQHHNLENRLRNSKKNPTIEYKHKCEDCEQIFKNSILLKRHICSSKKSKPTFKCINCPKTFRDITIFNMHKKSHNKENLIKLTSNVTISPKKFMPGPSTKCLVSYKCKECSKVCSSQSILSVHERSHKKFVCISCNTPFNSKLLLDTHVRIKCVKTSSPKDRRLSFKIRKSFVSSPRRTLTRGKSINHVKPQISNTSNRKSSIPTTNARKTISVIPKKSINPSSNVSKDAGSSKDLNTVPKKSMNLKPNMSFSLGKNINTNQRKSVNTFASARIEKMKANSSVLDTSNILGTSFNPGLNNSSMIRRLDVEAQCDSCSMMFSSLTALFKHKVKTHGLSTPDKRVLEEKKKLLHKPLHLHGGIQPNQSLNKAFQEMRKRLMSANTNFTENMDSSNKPQLTKITEKDELPKIIITGTTPPDQ